MNKKLLHVGAMGVVMIGLLLARPNHLTGTIQVFPPKHQGFSPGGYSFLGNVAGGCPGPDADSNPCIQMQRGLAVEVYSTSEVDDRIAVLTRNGGVIDQRVSNAETRIDQSVADGMNKLPARLLTDEAKEEIKTAVLADLKAQVEQLRSDVQKQIDDLKASR